MNEKPPYGDILKLISGLLNKNNSKTNGGFPLKNQNNAVFDIIKNLVSKQNNNEIQPGSKPVEPARKPTFITANPLINAGKNHDEFVKKVLNANKDKK